MSSVFEFAFVVRLDRRDTGGRLRKFRQETPVLETPRSPIISVEELVYGSWHMAVDELLQKSVSGGLVQHGGEVSKVINSLAHWIFPRGAKLVLVDSVDNSSTLVKPRLNQFLLTGSDYAKFYVHALELREELVIPECGHRRVYAPLAVGVVSRSPHLQLPRVVLAAVAAEADERGCLGEWSAAKRQRVVGALGYALEMRFPESRETSALWYPAREDKVEVLLGPEEADAICRLERGVLRPLFDVLSLSTVLNIMSVLFLEQKLVLVSFRWSPSLLMVLCEALRALMYPFDWHHVYLPAHPELDTLSQLQELRTFEVPAPLLAALRVLEPRNEAAMRAVAEVFPDIHFVDVDAGVLIPAAVRVDGRATSLPALPRRMVSAVTTRLKAELGVVPPSDAAAREAWAERLSEYEAWEVCDEARISRRAMRRVGRQGWTQIKLGAVAGAVTTTATATTVVQANPWFSGFLSKAQTSEEAKLLNSEPPDDPLGETATQTAFLEGLVRVLFLYGEFVQARETTEAGSFEGGERSFQGEDFLKELSKNASFHGFQSGDVDWLKEFIATQTWDLFLRTVAKSERGSLFDEACAQFKSLSRSPKSKKNLKESFCEELTGLVAQHRATASRRLVVGPRFFTGPPSPDAPQWGVLSPRRSPQAISDILAKVSDESLQPTNARYASHLLCRVLEYFAGSGNCPDPAVVPVQATRGRATDARLAALRNAWRASGFRVVCEAAETSDFDAVCRSCGYATGFWRSLRLSQWTTSTAASCSFPCPTCKGVVTPVFKTATGRATLAGFRILLASPGLEAEGVATEFTRRLLAATHVRLEGGLSFGLAEVILDLVEGGSSELGDSFGESAGEGSSADSPFARILLSGRSVEPAVAMRVAQSRAVERIKDYRKKTRKSIEASPVVTLRVTLSSRSRTMHSPPAPPREPKPETLAPRRPATLRN